jgi:hypothetical protein
LTTSQITALNSIMQGFSKTDLASLSFTSTTSINSLGALNLWSNDQVNILCFLKLKLILKRIILFFS